MKKAIIVFGLAMALLITAWMCWKESKMDMEYNFYEIYHEVKDIDFCSGKLTDGTLHLYDKNGTAVMDLRGDKYDRAKLVAVRKNPETDQIVFVVGGSADDEYGVLYEGKYGVDMEGIHRLERMGGGAFYYQTN